MIAPSMASDLISVGRSRCLCMLVPGVLYRSGGLRRFLQNGFTVGSSSFHKTRLCNKADITPHVDVAASNPRRSFLLGLISHPQVANGILQRQTSLRPGCHSQPRLQALTAKILEIVEDASLPQERACPKRSRSTMSRNSGPLLERLLSGPTRSPAHCSKQPFVLMPWRPTSAMRARHASQLSG